MSTLSPTPTHLAITEAWRHAGALLCCLIVLHATASAGSLTIEGVHVVPHVQSTEMRFRQKPDFSLGARVEVFLRNTSQETLAIRATTDVRVRGRTPEDLLKADEWAWHDLPSVWGGEPLRVPPGAMTVWSWNGKRALWGTNTQAELAVTLPGAGGLDRLAVPIDNFPPGCPL